ncbi:ornithine cyclodeaminase family protein [Roseomonas terrae]|jgi:alanine dehydrogenase|uniref:Ornithine cyclodeaminase family protein n=1 Tax=Neoroseomonas terrae TaxID=424799 RepID=A0ABS5EMY8_9PROT|nr:ornithine cyclodeaminase family protein [Neoroseomonas terrae]MBR0652394.1 ornithine cyclodeaminase family protein [Neoroseomonas terrae]
MLQLDRAALRRALPWDDLVAALDAMFREGCEAPLRHRHAMPGAEGTETTLLLMPAWRAGSHTGVKIVHVAPGNAARGEPAVHAAYLLSDALTGAPLALLDGGELTDRRTAAASLLAARHLARPDSARLLLLGSGKVARALAEGYAARFPITDIAIWSPTAANAARLAQTLAAEGLPARAVDSPEPAGADIISAATLSTVPLIRGEDLRPGTHVDLVGAYRRDMREADAAVLARATLVVDTRAGALAEAGDIVQAIAEGALTESAIVADLSDLCRGMHPGRRSAAEITAFKSVGWAGEDLAAAVLAYRWAVGEGLRPSPSLSPPKAEGPLET